MLERKNNMKIALVHDYLREYGGAERVLEALHAIYPDAPLYTAFVDPDAMGIHWKKFENWTIHQSWMTKIPFYKKLYSPLRLIANQFFEQFDLSEYDVVISSSNMYFAKAVITKPWTTHICYCHTPPRSLYGYSTMTDWQKNIVIKILGQTINHLIRPKDYLAAQRVDIFIANSGEVKNRIQKFYRRDSVVIHPPVEISKQIPDSRFQSRNLKTDQLTNRLTDQPYFLYVNRLAFSKHPELAIQVCNELDLKLKVVGSGAIEEELKNMAAETVEFLGAVSDKKLHELYAGATALLYPVEDEDFGMVPVEAMGHGVPVIAHRSGGPLETIVEGKTGVFFDELSVESMKTAITTFQKKKWDRAQIHTHAKKFDTKRFEKEIRALVQKQISIR